MPKIGPKRGDWRLIYILLRYRVTDPDKILQLLPEDSEAKVNEIYFAGTLMKAWQLVKKYREVRDIMKTNKTKARRLLMMIIAEEIINEYKPVAVIIKNDEKEVFHGFYVFSKKERNLNLNRRDYRNNNSRKVRAIRGNQHSGRHGT